MYYNAIWLHSSWQENHIALNSLWVKCVCNLFSTFLEGEKLITSSTAFFLVFLKIQTSNLKISHDVFKEERVVISEGIGLTDVTKDVAPEYPKHIRRIRLNIAVRTRKEWVWIITKQDKSFLGYFNVILKMPHYYADRGLAIDRRNR